MTDHQANGEAMEEELTQAVDGIVSRHNGGMATKWAMVVETINADGERGMWSFTSAGIAPWDTLGLFSYAIKLEELAIGRHEYPDNDG